MHASLSVLCVLCALSAAGSHLSYETLRGDRDVGTPVGQLPASFCFLDGGALPTGRLLTCKYDEWKVAHYTFSFFWTLTRNGDNSFSIGQKGYVNRRKAIRRVLKKKKSKGKGKHSNVSSARTGAVTCLNLKQDSSSGFIDWDMSVDGAVQPLEVDVEKFGNRFIPKEWVMAGGHCDFSQNIQGLYSFVPEADDTCFLEDVDTADQPIDLLYGNEMNAPADQKARTCVSIELDSDASKHEEKELLLECGQGLGFGLGLRRSSGGASTPRKRFVEFYGGQQLQKTPQISAEVELSQNCATEDICVDEICVEYVPGGGYSRTFLVSLNGEEIGRTEGSSGGNSYMWYSLSSKVVECHAGTVPKNSDGEPWSRYLDGYEHDFGGIFWKFGHWKCPSSGN